MRRMQSAEKGGNCSELKQSDNQTREKGGKKEKRTSENFSAIPETLLVGPDLLQPIHERFIGPQ